MIKELINYMDSVITATGKVTLNYGDDDFYCEVELTGKASDVFTIDDNLNISVIDGEVLGSYNTEEEVRLVLKEMGFELPMYKTYSFANADVISEQVREEKIWDNVMNHLMKTFKIDKDTAYSMAQIMLEGESMDNWSDWE